MQETQLSTTDKEITEIRIRKEKLSSRFGFEPDTEEKVKFFYLCSAIDQCAKTAEKNQKIIHRSFKADGTILTETDLAVSKTITSLIEKLYPESNIVTEENDSFKFNSAFKYTFVLDPIDGTDVYSQGFPSWAVSLGILDKKRKPVGAIVASPRFNLFICTIPGLKKVYINGNAAVLPKHYEVPRQMTVSSEIIQLISIPEGCDIKFRSFGSGILSTLCPCVFSNIDCSLVTPAYAWDYAGSHAIASKMGMKVCLLNGKELIYDDSVLLKRNKVSSSVICGNEECCNFLINNFKEKN